MESVNSLRISAPQWWPLREGRDGKCEGRNEKCEFLARESVSSSPIVRIFGEERVNSSPILARQWWRHFRLSLSVCLYLSLSLSLSPKVPHAQYRKRGSASYIVREVLLVRERERYRERKRDRRKWRHHCRAKIGDEFTLSLAKNSHNWRWAYTFPCQKFALFVSPFTLPVSPFTERSPWWRWNSQWVHTFQCQKFFALRLCSPSFKWHEPRDEWSKTQDKWSNLAQSYFVLPIEKLNQINTKNYWK